MSNLQELCDELGKFVETAIYNADRGRSKIKNERLMRGIFGFSSERIRHLLNNLCAVNNTVYMELGTYRGSTLLPAINGNDNITVYAVDSFKYDVLQKKPVNPEGWPQIKKGLLENLEVFKEKDKVTIIEKDFSNLSKNEIDKPVSVCFYDGGIAPGLSEVAMAKVAPLLSKVAIVVCSTLMSEEVTNGAKKGLTDRGKIIQKEFKLKSRKTNDNTSWWSGISIWIVTDKPEEVKTTPPKPILTKENKKG